MLDSKQSALLSQEAQTWSPLHRECYVALTGAGDGIVKSVQDALTTDTEATAKKFLSSAALGAAFSGLASSSRWGELTVAAATGSFLYAAAKDAYGRAIPTWDAIKDAGSSAASLNRDRGVVAASVGPFAVDWAITGIGGEFGGSLALGTRYARSISSSEHNGMLEQLICDERSGTPGAELKRSVVGRERTIGVMAEEFMTQENLKQVSPAARSVYEHSVPGMFKLEASRDSAFATSTAFITGPRGQAVTNFHSIAHADSIRLIDSQGVSYQARVISADPAHELALVAPLDHYGAILDRFQPLPLAETSKLTPGDQLIAIGYGGKRRGGYPLIAEGQFQELRFPNPGNGPNEIADNERVLYSNVNVTPGYSGGPLLKEDGTVVGINYARTETSKSASTVPVEAIRRFLANEKLENSGYFPLQSKIQGKMLDASDSREIATVYDRAQQSVFQLKGKFADGTTSLATAFAIDDTHLLTSARAVPAQGSVLSLSRNGVWQDKVQVERTDPRLGVAVLTRISQGSDAAAQIPLTFRTQSIVTPHEDLMALGFAEKKAQMSVALGQLDYLGYKIAAGFDGAPVTDRGGNLVGMARVLDPETGKIKVITPPGLKTALQRAGIGVIKRTLD